MIYNLVICELIAFFPSNKGREDSYPFPLFAQSHSKEAAQFGKVFVDDRPKALWAGHNFIISYLVLCEFKVWCLL